MISKVLQMKNARLILGLALLIILLSFLFGLPSFDAHLYSGVQRIPIRCSSAWWSMQESGLVRGRSGLCDFAASSRRYTILFVAVTTFSILAGGILVSERLRKKT